MPTDKQRLDWLDSFCREERAIVFDATIYKRNHRIEFNSTGKGPRVNGANVRDAIDAAMLEARKQKAGGG